MNVKAAEAQCAAEAESVVRVPGEARAGVGTNGPSGGCRLTVGANRVFPTRNRLKIIYDKLRVPKVRAKGPTRTLAFVAALTGKRGYGPCAIPRSPKNRTIRHRARHWPKRRGRNECAQFSVYRWNPDARPKNPKSIAILSIGHCGPNAPRRADQDQKRDRSNADLRGPAERGFADPAAMNIDASTRWPASYGMDEVKGDVKSIPCRICPSLKDLIPDLTHFYAQPCLPSSHGWKPTTPRPDMNGNSLD